MSDLSLRPRSAAEIIDAAFRMYRQYFVGFITLSAIVYLPIYVVRVLFARMLPLIEEGQPGPLLAVFIGLLIFLLWMPIVEASLSIAASDRYHGREIEPARAIGDALTRIGKLFIVKSWTWFILSLAFIFLIIPFFYFFARYFAVPQAMLFERTGIRRGLARSRQLAKGEKWKILKTLGLIWLIVMAATATVDLMMQPDPGDAPSMLSQLLGSLVSMIVYPLVPITATLLYYDVRIRREGYDIEVLSAELEGPAPVAAARQG